jgi:hypothetical protein
MLLMTGTHPQRRRRSGPRSAASAVGAQRRALTDDRSGGYARHRCPTLSFQHVHAQQPPRLHTTPTERPFSSLAADSTHVPPQQPVNTNVFAVVDCMALIPHTFPYGN